MRTSWTFYYVSLICFLFIPVRGFRSILESGICHHSQQSSDWRNLFKPVLLSYITDPLAHDGFGSGTKVGCTIDWAMVRHANEIIHQLK